MGIGASVSRKSGVAVERTLNQAIADLSETVRDFLTHVHASDVTGVQARADGYVRSLREFVRCTGVDLEALPAWNANTTNWRAVARLAGATITSDETSQAG